MADTASLVARVKTEGVAAGAKQLDGFAKSADSADAAVNKLTPDVGKVNVATQKAANDGFAKFRNAAGQVGFQVQDMVVQLQSGTSAFVAIGQQGSQLAGAFGPGGAVLGAVIALASAIGGVLYKALGDSTKSTEELDKSAGELAKSFQQSKDGTLEFSDALVALSQSGDLAYDSTVKLLGLKAQQQLEQTTSALEKQGQALLGNSVSAQTSIASLDDLIASGKDVASTLDNINVVTDASSGVYANLKAAVGEISDEYGVGTKAVTDMLVAQREFNKEPSAENAQRLADAQANLAQEATKNKQAAIDQAAETQKLAINLSTAEKQLNLVTEAQKRNGDATNSTTKRINEQNEAIIRNTQIANLSERDRATAMAAADKEAFAKREGVTKEQIAAYNAARDEEARQDIARIDKTEKEKNDRINKAAKTKADAEAKRTENESQRQQKAADTFLNTLARQNKDELAAIDSQEQQKLEQLQKFNEMGRIVGQQYEDAKTQIALDADAKRNDLLEKQTEERMKKQNSADSFIEQLRAQNEGELAEIDRQQAIKEQKLDDFYKQGLIAEEDYQKARQDIQGEADKKRLDSYTSTLSDTTSALKNALGEGNALYKAAAITETIINTYKAATGAYSALAPIPIVGPALGAAAAAAAIASGLATVGKIRSAREQGGNLSAGQASTIAERGKPEVIMPAGASRVRTAEQMRQIMGESGGKNNGAPQISIINQTTGRIDDVQQQQDDEGRITLLIREVVSGDFQDSNSRIAKSRKVSRGQPGMS